MTMLELLKTVSKEDIINYYSSHSLSDTSKYYNVVPDTLRRYFRKEGIELRSTSEERKLTCISKYGCDNPSKSSNVINKIAKSKEERYGSATYNNRDKAKKTCLDKYGVDSATKLDSTKEKVKATFKEHYGVDNFFKRVDLLQQRYIEIDGSLEEHNKKTGRLAAEALIEKYGVSNPGMLIEQNANKVEHAKSTCREKYGVDFNCLIPYVTSNKSKDTLPNLSFEKLLNDNGIVFEREIVIGGKYRYDFKVGNTVIEINPTITHNITFSPYGTTKEISYHKNKTEFAREHGFRCINIWDWDELEKIIILLKNKETVYARKCEVKEIDILQAKKFIEQNHLQGYTNDKIRIGLFYNDELVSVMTFGKPRYNKNYQWELIRFCASKNIIGGANKLFSYFIKKYSPETIISYCDKSKFDGHTYLNLGFNEIRNKIGMHWYNGKQHILDSSLRKIGFDKLFGTDYGKGTSNKELMIKNGFFEVADSGQSTYVYKSK